jgi:methylenetetrahydrofolate reductase (NADPH)
LAKKVAAGADFIQTQCIYDMERFKEWMKMVRDRGLHEKVHIMAGVTPLKSGGMARYMNSNVSGITIPEEILDRMVKAPKPAEEGIELCLEQIQELRGIEGVHGVHIMAIEWEHRLAVGLEKCRRAHVESLTAERLGPNGVSNIFIIGRQNTSP